MHLEKLLVDALENHLSTGKSPRVPEGAWPIWSAFGELSAARSWGPHAPNPLAFSEIEAWARLTRWPLEPHHVRLLSALDRTWMAHAARALSSSAQGHDRAPRPVGKLTAELFDRVVR